MCGRAARVESEYLLSLSLCSLEVCQEEFISFMLSYLFFYENILQPLINSMVVAIQS